MAQRPPITCHILDTHTGIPAAGVQCQLTLLGPAQNPAPATVSSDISSSSMRNTFYGTTNSDGRIGAWISRAVEWAQPEARPPEEAGHEALKEVFDKTEGEMLWKLTFKIGNYWTERNVRSFFPQVEITFVTVGYRNRQEGDADREHWHVPLLVGPFSYTTYRGS